MRRRGFIGAIYGATLALPFGSYGQKLVMGMTG
jgi:hypothetical protein